MIHSQPQPTVIAQSPPELEVELFLQRRRVVQLAVTSVQSTMAPVILVTGSAVPLELSVSSTNTDNPTAPAARLALTWSSPSVPPMGRLTGTAVPWSR